MSYPGSKQIPSCPAWLTCLSRKLASPRSRRSIWPTETFLDPEFQNRHSITSPVALQKILGDLVDERFLALDVCPAYCRFCTRSCAIGGSTITVEIEGYKPQASRRQQGLAFMLPARKLRELLLTLLAIPHVRRIRVASKGPAVMSMKVLGDTAWTDALCEAVDRGRESGKEVCLHTHFNTPEEISWITRDAMAERFRRAGTGALGVRSHGRQHLPHPECGC